MPMMAVLCISFIVGLLLLSIYYVSFIIPQIPDAKTGNLRDSSLSEGGGGVM